MSSVYDQNLPQAFPWRVRLMSGQINRRVEALTRASRSDVPNLSSFAVTADAKPGWTYLWLSDVSARFLIENGWLQMSDLGPRSVYWPNDPNF